MSIEEIEQLYISRVGDNVIREKNLSRISFVKEKRKTQQVQSNYAEMRFAKKLTDAKLSFERQTYIACTNEYTGLIYHLYVVDFYIPELSLVIEIDGAYHKTEDTRKRDEALHMSNYEVMHLPDNFTDLQADILVADIKAINSPG